MLFFFLAFFVAVSCRRHLFVVATLLAYNVMVCSSSCLTCSVRRYLFLVCHRIAPMTTRVGTYSPRPTTEGARATGWAGLASDRAIGNLKQRSSLRSRERKSGRNENKMSIVLQNERKTKTDRARGFEVICCAPHDSRSHRRPFPSNRITRATRRRLCWKYLCSISSRPVVVSENIVDSTGRPNQKRWPYYMTVVFVVQDAPDGPSRIVEERTELCAKLGRLASFFPYRNDMTSWIVFDIRPLP